MRAVVPATVAAVLLGGAPRTAAGADTLNIVEVRLDRPTVRALGVQVLLSYDDNRNAVAAVRVREIGGGWRDAPALFRVWPETVGIAVPEQLSGSVFDLEPDTSYEIEVHFVDPDGLDETRLISAATRPIPKAEPDSPRAVPVADAASLRAALAAAVPGDVITLANGTYDGQFVIHASGTAADPIVIRGGEPGGATLDGNDCSACNILEVYGSFVHVEDLSLVRGERALRFQGIGTEANVLRRVAVTDVRHGVGSRDAQTDYYVCDNDIRGRLDWPWVFDDDASLHWDDRGIDLNGDGHVVCHNRIDGFGDPMVNLTEGSRSWDFYGNDVFDCFDGIEVDRAAGNVRVFRNRWTNVDTAISLQPINGGPAYVVRNEALNVVHEQLKLKQTGGEPSGALVHHNTFVSATLAMNLQTPVIAHNFEVTNNVFVGPDDLNHHRAVDWTAGVDGDLFDHNGYLPDGEFWFGHVAGENRLYASFAEAMASGEVEPNGVLLSTPVFGNAAVGPPDPTATQTPSAFELAIGSNAIDAGRALPGINSGFGGAAPDLGARELGCDGVYFGPRPADEESDYVPIDCDPEAGPGDDGGSEGGGTGGRETDPGSSAGGSVSGGSDEGADAGSAGSTTEAADTGATAGANGENGCGCRHRGGASPMLALCLLAVLCPLRRS